jgi:hypothetical protein
MKGFTTPGSRGAEGAERVEPLLLTRDDRQGAVQDTEQCTACFRVRVNDVLNCA